MIYAEIDVAKDKHDCFISDSNGLVLHEPFIIANNRNGFRKLIGKLKSCSEDINNIKIRLESADHYSDNLLEFLITNSLQTVIINPLRTNFYRKGNYALERRKQIRSMPTQLCLY